MDDCTCDPSLEGATCFNCRARQNEQLARARNWRGYSSDEYGDDMLEPGDETGRTLGGIR